ncbi:MAG TPA: hypothetical protein VMT17_12810 [Anaeromyxobacteraceae bacterium]|nr:hypothetical protein [Anaeromyxobacteraceae bacterium]
MKPGILHAGLAALLLAAGCTRDLGPEGAYRSLARAVSDRDADGAWALLSAGTQRWLEERAARAAAAAPGVVAPSARALLLGDAAAGVVPPAAISVASRSLDRAVLSVAPAGGGASRDVVAVREGGRWRIDLSPPAP